MRRCWLFLLVVFPGVGCDDSSSGGEADAGPPVSLWVDTDRDGVLTAADVAGQDTWTAEHGAAFLANVDDDDSDGERDAEDGEVNGDDDAKDLARVQVTAWAEALDGAHATLQIDGLANVRWFRQSGTSWTDVGAASVALDTAALIAGATFGIEGLALLENDGWDGRVTLTLTVHEAADEATPPIVSASAVLRQAPIVLGYNTAPTLRVFASDINDFGGEPLLSSLDDLTLAADAENYTIDGWNPDYLTGTFPNQFPDQWTQDFFEIGAMYLPVSGGMNRMGVGLRLKPPSEAGNFVANELFGPDFAAIYPFLTTYDEFSDGSSLDYGGNLDVVPPHEGYPVGRIIVGTTPARHIDDHYAGVLGAQYAQTPVLEPDTSWLAVGHIDEVLSFVADPSSPLGWKAVLQAPAEAWQMLEDMVAADAANANLPLFTGKNWLDFVGGSYAADTTVGEILADADLATAQDEGQARADELRDFLKTEVGLTDDDIIDLPFLWESFAAGPSGELRHVAYSPGVANLLTFNGQALIARPFGPVVADEDLFEKVPRERLEALGLTVTFVDDWDLYHRLEGEVHCGTNVDRTLPEGAAWWEMSR